MYKKILDEKLNLDTFLALSLGTEVSPLGIYDKALWEAKDYLKRNSIIFSPGLNEDLAATAVWGTQQPNLSCQKLAK